MSNPIRPPWRRRLLRSGIGLLTLAAIVGAGEWASRQPPTATGRLAVAGAVILVSLTIAVTVEGMFAEQRRTEGARQELRKAEEELEDSLRLQALWNVTHRRLDLYHRIATRQAKTSFYSAQAAMVVGFGLLIVFAVLTAKAQTTAASVVTGALGAASAAFAGYIGRTFVRSQEASAAHLRTYFDQPVELFRYLAAERLLEGLDPAQRAAVVADLARAIVAPSAAPAASSSGTATAPLPNRTAPAAGSKPDTDLPIDCQPQPDPAKDTA